MNMCKSDSHPSEIDIYFTLSIPFKLPGKNQISLRQKTLKNWVEDGHREW